MKRFNILAAVLLIGLVNSVVYGQKQDSSSLNQVFGKNFEQKKTANIDSRIYENIQAKDTIATQLEGEVNEVCQAKGCWMKVNLVTNEEVFVKFKDYGFFVPLDASGKKVILNGKAFVEELSVEEQRHYALDEGVSKEEIAKITSPKKTLRFEADGVILKK